MTSGTPASVVVDAVFGPASSTIESYVDILASRGIEWGLLGPREAGRLWERHVLNSVALTSVIPTGARTVDVGSGAGLPGIPLAVLRPDLEMVLLEPLQRRAEFLELAVDELGLDDRVTVVRGRAEELKDRFDVVTGRAVAPLTKLLEWCMPLFVPRGQMVMLKGASAPDEVAKAGKELKKARLVAQVRQVRAHPAAEPTSAVVVRPA
ncbi:16S rRNA (guanine(527)-N(7))-methyltransferase RsmG [Aestuariimicrobium ganziense]|uniref:16S rRNA (guanine(527)-N(7))-methyltransferase RsmG n=1 Tax=Aestuariimicrobium ganziense TaxID=2773677 RepID=UPI001940D60A|nr:16S rRNA (guanine(527)-N(7))-methyltransferase RsmG [Aestuariimicrobium ganziense]